MKKVITFLLALLISSCNNPSVNLEKLSNDAVILAFGDSLTYGTGATDGQAYPSILEKLTSREVVNEGIPGEITRDGTKRLPELLNKIHPELLILIHGGNDMIKKIPKQEISANLAKMITEAKQRDISVILIGVPEPKLLISSSSDIYQNLAAQFQIPADLDTLPEILSTPSLKSDLIHPNAEGYSFLAKKIHELLKQSGAL